MFCSACGDQVGYLTEKGAEIVFLCSSRPHKLHGRQGSYLARFHDSVPLVGNVHGLVYSRLRGMHKHNPP